MDAYGELKQPPRQGSRGPLPAPRIYPPPDLCYAVVVKERERGRVVNVTTRIVYGTEEQIRTALHNSPVSQAINTYGVVVLHKVVPVAGIAESHAPNLTIPDK